jgi:serine-type D-Ala-D-Ala carboxypeptidase/endopeptidase
MKKINCLFLALFLAFVPAISHAQNKPSALDTLVNKLGEKLIIEKQAVGLSIGIYNNGAGYFYNFGSTVKDKQSLPTQNTVYEIGSITKTFVSYILANAVLEKKVKLEDDIRMYLKEKYPNLEYEGHPIQLVHLANTTSLLPDWLPELPAAMENLPADSVLQLKISYYNKLTKNDLFTALHSVKLDSIPGTRRYHSNAGAQLLAFILEDVYGTDIEMLIKKYITRHYKMKNTSFISLGINKKLATGYNSAGNEARYEYVIPYFKTNGGMASTSHDLVNYIKMLLDKNNPAAALCLKKTVDIDVSTGKRAPMRPDNTAAPEVYSAALNWFKYQPSISYAQIWSDGGTNGFNSYLVLYPQMNSGIILLANKSDEKIFRALPGIASEISKQLGK